MWRPIRHDEWVARVSHPRPGHARKWDAGNCTVSRVCPDELYRNWTGTPFFWYISNEIHTVSVSADPPIQLATSPAPRRAARDRGFHAPFRALLVSSCGGFSRTVPGAPCARFRVALRLGRSGCSRTPRCPCADHPGGCFCAWRSRVPGAVFRSEPGPAKRGPAAHRAHARGAHFVLLRARCSVPTPRSARDLPPLRCVRTSRPCRVPSNRAVRRLTSTAFRRP